MIRRAGRGVQSVADAGGA